MNNAEQILKIYVTTLSEAVSRNDLITTIHYFNSDILSLLLTYSVPYTDLELVVTNNKLYSYLWAHIYFLLFIIFIIYTYVGHEQQLYSDAKC